MDTAVRGLVAVAVTVLVAGCAGPRPQLRAAAGPVPACAGLVGGPTVGLQDGCLTDDGMYLPAQGPQRCHDGRVLWRAGDWYAGYVGGVVTHQDAVQTLSLGNTCSVPVRSSQRPRPGGGDRVGAARGATTPPCART